MRVLCSFLLLAIGLLAGCVSPGAGRIQELDRATQAFLLDHKETFYSEVLSGEQRVVLEIELIDGVTPATRESTAAGRGYWTPAGMRRVQFRVYLPPVGWNNGRGREARAMVEVALLPGHRYHLVGDYSKGVRFFTLVDAATREPVSQPVDVGFLGAVQRAPGIVPLIIPAP